MPTFVNNRYLPVVETQHREFIQLITVQHTTTDNTFLFRSKLFFKQT